jgi:hypothetical protein
MFQPWVCDNIWYCFYHGESLFDTIGGRASREALERSCPAVPAVAGGKLLAG